jgi:hypothetical protein
VSVFSSPGCGVRDHAGFTAPDHPLALHEHAAQALEGQRGYPRTWTCQGYPEQVQGEGEQVEGDQDDRRRHHRLCSLLDPSAGSNLLLNFDENF